MFKGLTRSLHRLFAGRMLTVLRRDQNSGAYVEDKDLAEVLKTRKKK